MKITSRYKNFLTDALFLFNVLKKSSKKTFFYIFLYYLLLIVNSIFETAGLVLVTSLFTNSFESLISSQTFFLRILDFFISLNFEKVYLITIILFLGVFSRIILLIFYKSFVALIRYEIQTQCFYAVLNSDWSISRDINKGEALNIISNEAAKSSKFISALIDIFSYVISLTIIILIMIDINFSATYSLLLLALFPSIVISFIYKQYSKLAKFGVYLRNIFSAEISSRLNGLMQVSLDNNFDYHHKNAKNIQKKITFNDIRVGICQAFLGSTNQILAFFCFVILSVLIFINSQYNIDYPIYATLIILALRGFSQMGLVLSSIGGLVEVHASVSEVNKLLNLPQKINKIILKDKVTEISLSNVNFSYDNNILISNLNYRFIVGNMYHISGPSGSGKSTLANIIASLLIPNKGNIEYISNEIKYNSKKYLPKISYVTQDVQLFNGSIRENFQLKNNFDENYLFSILKKIGSEKFINKIGGLDTYIEENAKNLSGGQKRLLSIARGIFKNVDIFIFDEVFSGLDKSSKKLLNRVIFELSKTYIVLMISHEPVDFKNKIVLNLNEN